MPVGPVFNEFSLKLPVPAELLITKMRELQFHAGIASSENTLLIAVTETKSLADLNRYAESFRQSLTQLSPA